MGSPRGVLVGVLLVLALLLGTVGMMVRSGDTRALRAGAALPPIAGDGSARGIDDESESTEVRLDPPGEHAGERANEGAPQGPAVVPEALAAKFEKRYRGFAPDALELARMKLGETLRVRADQVLRERLKVAGTPTTRPVIDLAHDESTRELTLEIAWLEARLPNKE